MPRLIDLSQTLRAGMRGVTWETAATLEREGWNARTLHLYSHAGTHMDAQAHFAAGPETIDAFLWSDPWVRLGSWTYPGLSRGR